MADSVIGSIAVQIKAKNDALVNGLKESNEKIKDFKGKFAADFGHIATVGAAAFAAVAFAVKKSIDAAAESEQAQNDLAIALRNAGQGSKEALDASLAYSKQLMEQTGISDELINRTQTELVQFGLTGDALKVATQAAADLATAKKIDLTQAAEQVGKAFLGETSRLKQFGIVIDESVPATERFKIALAQMNERFGGAAQGQLDTYAGQMKLLQEQFGEAQESIGNLFLPILSALLPKINEAAKLTLQFADAIKQKVSNFGFARTALAAYIDLWGVFLEMIRTVINSIPGLDTVLKGMGSSLQSVNATLDTAQSKLSNMNAAVLNNANITKAADASVAQNKTAQEQIRAQQMIAIQQLEAQSKAAIEAEKLKKEKENQADSEKFTTEMQKLANERQQKTNQQIEKTEAEHRKALETIADQSETAMTTIFSRELDARQKKQKLFSQVMDQIQKQVTSAFIAAQSKQKAEAISTSAVETAAAKPAIAAGFFKAHAGLPFVGQAIALAFIAAAFGFIDRLVKFNKGGEVGGIGSGDTVPAMLTPGERVLTKDQNAMFNSLATAAANGISGGAGGGPSITINIQGTLLEGSETKWANLVRNKLIPEIRRATQFMPTGPFNRVRGAP